MVDSGAVELRERAAELSTLRRAIDAAVQGTGRLVLVTGAPGIGKSSLLAAARRSAGDCRVLAARSSELESTFPMGVVRQLLGSPLAAGSTEDVAGWFQGAAALARPVFDAALEVTGGEDEDSFRTLHGLHWLVANLAREEPLVLLVDDAQWADHASLAFLGYLARRLADLPVTLVVACRPLTAQSPHLLAELAAQPDVLRIEPAALSRTAVDEIVTERLGPAVPETFAAACCEVTRGNPFLLTELLREVGSQRLDPTEETARRVGTLAPSGVAAVMAVRLARLPGRCRDLAEAVAVLGDRTAVPVAAKLAGVPPNDVGSTVSDLVEAGLLATDGAALQFVHPLVRATVAHALGAAELGLRHRRAAALLREEGASDDEIAAHLLMAPPAGDADTVTILRSAAARAEALGAPSTAAAMLERALREPPVAENRGDVLVDLGRVEARAGVAEAETHLRTALALPTSGPEVPLRAALELGRFLKFSGRVHEAIEVLGDALAGAAARSETAALVELELLGMAYTSVSARRSLAELRAAITEPERAPRSPVDAFSLAALAFDNAAANGTRARTLDLVRRAVGGLPADADPTAGGYGFVILTVACTWADHLADALELTDRMVSDGRRNGRPVAVATGALMRALVGYHRGRLTEAAADATTALEMAPVLPGSHPLLTTAHAIAILEAVERTTSTEELAEVDRQARALFLDADALPYVLVLHARGLLSATLGDHARAVDQFLAAGDHATSWGAISPAVVPWRSDAAYSLRALGRADEAAPLVEEELGLARACGAARPLGMALRAAAALVPAAEAVGLLEEAVGVLESSPSELERARALVDLGRALRLAGRPRDAREPLRLGLELAVHCGSNRLAAAAHDELRTAGVRPRRVAVTGVDALTPAERRVAELAATGSANRAIAEQLFISEKTVEGHLGRVYDKLGVRSRAQLRGLLPLSGTSRRRRPAGVRNAPPAGFEPATPGTGNQCSIP